MKKKGSVFFILLCIAVLVFTGCSTTKSVYSNADKENKGEGKAENGKAYTEHGFKVSESIVKWSATDAMPVPKDQDIVFSFNNTIDGTVIIKADNKDVLVLNVKYTVDEDVKGQVKLVVKDEEGNEYTHETEKEFAFAKEGENSISAMVKTKGAVEGKYDFSLYINDDLALEASYTHKE
ncbi:hypothetical protein M2454_002859 [Aequitasia blattaphilus]|uniref:Lipoprotein n=1 Tax=Aequitasia blattaphilus TaxID=2949332 RepID=A0ABT1ECX3_9FIRM|nr:hypothetical protein [Aequitasia blattaphilus]MCP1103526.1 hypothetical protein [Aequitasia blattaphilus]MCR8616166.1 hypothetical protein [Aequitasia blattaphilus]